MYHLWIHLYTWIWSNLMLHLFHLSVFAKVKTSQAELVGKALHSAVDTETDRPLEKTICFYDDVENSNICRIDEWGLCCTNRWMRLIFMKVDLHVIPTEVVFFNLTGTLTEGNSNHQKNWYFYPSTSNFSQLLELKVYRRHAGVVGMGWVMHSPGFLWMWNFVFQELFPAGCPQNPRQMREVATENYEKSKSTCHGIVGCTPMGNPYIRPIQWVLMGYNPQEFGILLDGLAMSFSCRVDSVKSIPSWEQW